MAANNEINWGRVDEEGNVFLRQENGEERLVGQYLSGSPEEALAFYQRKYDDLAAQVSLLEQRVKANANANDLLEAHSKLSAAVPAADVIGDLKNLVDRLEALSEQLSAVKAQQQEEHQQAIAEALTARESLVAEFEELLKLDKEKIQWKTISAQIDGYFQRWQQLQQQTPRIPKKTADELWDRFRTVKNSLESSKREFFAKLDAKHKEAKEQKSKLVEKAEALISRGAEATGDYRQLLAQWKTAGRAGKKFDDQLWEKFKAAGDAIYSAKSEQDRIDNQEFQGNLEQKDALLARYEDLLQLTELEALKKRWSQFLAEWDGIGRVPRDEMKRVDAQFKKFEQHVKKHEQEHWQKNNPETKARVEGLASQLTKAIEQLEQDLEAAKAKGDKKKVSELEESIATRKSWLSVIE